MTPTRSRIDKRATRMPDLSTYIPSSAILLPTEGHSAVRRRRGSRHSNAISAGGGGIVLRQPARRRALFFRSERVEVEVDPGRVVVAAVAGEAGAPADSRPGQSRVEGG